MYGCFSPSSVLALLCSSFFLLLHDRRMLSREVEMKVARPQTSKHLTLKVEPLSCTAFSFLYSCKLIIREKQLVRDYRRTRPRQCRSAINLIWKVGHVSCILFPSLFKAAAIIACRRRKAKKKNRNKKTNQQKQKAKHPIYLCRSRSSWIRTLELFCNRLSGQLPSVYGKKC